MRNNPHSMFGVVELFHLNTIIHGPIKKESISVSRTLFKFKEWESLLYAYNLLTSNESGFVNTSLCMSRS